MVLETVNGIKLGESKVADLVDPSTIRFSSRISNNRICVHFSEKEAFDKSTSSHKSITIRGYTIQVRSLISRAKRIIISNACPTIPNEDIQDSLVKLDIRLKSEPHSSESEVTTSGRPMLHSYRRQVYIDEEYLQNDPKSILLSSEGQKRNILLNEDG